MSSNSSNVSSTLQLTVFIALLIEACMKTKFRYGRIGTISSAGSTNQANDMHAAQRESKEEGEVRGSRGYHCDVTSGEKS